jgi:DNA-directed RNA polymerase I, II, and III subunit RPABC2
MSDIEDDVPIDDDVSDVLDDISLDESSSYDSSNSESDDSDDTADDDDKVSVISDTATAPDAELEPEVEPEVESDPIPFEIKEDVSDKYKPYKSCVFVDPDKRITSDYLSAYEYASVIGYLAELISKTGVINIDHKGEYDSIKIAEMTFKERRTGLIIKRFVGTNKKGLSEYELWKVDELKY